MFSPLMNPPDCSEARIQGASITRLNRGQERLETQRSQAGTTQEDQGSHREIDDSTRG